MGRSAQGDPAADRLDAQGEIATAVGDYPRATRSPPGALRIARAAGAGLALALLGTILLSLAAVVGRRGRQRLAPG